MSAKGRTKSAMHAVGAALAWLALAGAATPGAASPWGADYFPNVPLTTHDGRSVRFFDDLIEGKIVAVNFIYTSCPDICPLETAQLVQVQKILGDRLGKDVFFYSITIDPEKDTPEALASYRKKFGARWTFLTGEESDITELRKKLGLYIEEIQDGSNNHNVSMIIGNQATGRWMKRSPFENPHVLADQLANWLDSWRSKPRGQDYASAPQLRSIPRGEQIYRTRCATCHSLTGDEPANALGPDLLGVTHRRERAWLLEWLRAPDEMLARKDPIAVALYREYNQLAMPNMHLNKAEGLALLDYIDSETRRLVGKPMAPAVPMRVSVSSGTARSVPQGDVVAIANAWVRETPEGAKVNAGYMTLVNLGDESVTLVRIASDAFDSVEVHEMAKVDGLMTMRAVSDLLIPARGRLLLEPGGKHLMLIEPTRQLARAQRVEFTLTFDSGRTQSVSATVAAR